MPTRVPQSADGWSRADIYLAFRQAKTALFYERRGVDLLPLADFEANLPARLAQFAKRNRQRRHWFAGVPPGDVWVVPKRLKSEDPGPKGVVRIGPQPDGDRRRDLEIQVRLGPDPAFATTEVLYLWQFGPALEALLAPHSVGYRLDLRQGDALRTRRWLFDYWPKRYQEFRSEPLDAAQRLLARGAGTVVLSADLATFYDSVDPSFLLDEAFVAELETAASGKVHFNPEEYRVATASLLAAYDQFRRAAASATRLEWRTGVPIGSLTSRLVANLSLATLDRHVLAQPDVVCYRRYVDDFVIVARRGAPYGDARSVLARFIPLRADDQDSRGFRLDTARLARPGSEFAIQNEKLRVHDLAGAPGRDFISAVAGDFSRLVSERRAFLDPAALLGDGARHLIRAGQAEGSPLRVLRDADRTRLERFALSNHLRSLERATSMLDAEHARVIVRQALAEVGRAVVNDGDWVGGLDVTLRLLRVAIAAEDWDSAAELLAQTDLRWSTAEALQATVGRLTHRGRHLPPGAGLVSLRNYLHARRLEAVCSVIPLALTSEQGAWLGDGLWHRTSRLGLRALRTRARSLSESDLRSRDREDDALHGVQSQTEAPDRNWVQGSLGEDAALHDRFRAIGQFVDRCEELGDHAWVMPPARLFLCTRPPSYFDVARRWLYRAETRGFTSDVFTQLKRVVNAVRGTAYSDPIAEVLDDGTVAFPSADYVSQHRASDPRLILGSLVAENSEWEGAATRVPGSRFGRPSLSPKRLLGLTSILNDTLRIAKKRKGWRTGQPTSLLVLPELSLPRRWLRPLASFVSNIGLFGVVVGLEYLHDRKFPYVFNQVFAVLPGPFSMAAAWPWTKRLPAREEARYLANQKPRVEFPPVGSHTRNRRLVVSSVLGDFSVLVCSELIESRRVADLLGRVEYVLSPSWNKDTASYDHLVQSVGLHLNAIVGVANNGIYSDSRAWAPLEDRWRRDLCRLIERGESSVVFVDLPLGSLRAFRASSAPANPPPAKPTKGTLGWRPLPPDWPPHRVKGGP